MKKPWLALALNLWPLPLGLGYAYLRRWDRLVVSVLGLQIMGVTLLKFVFGSGSIPYNCGLLAMWGWALYDVYQLAKKHNATLEPEPTPTPASQGWPG